MLRLAVLSLVIGVAVLSVVTQPMFATSGFAWTFPASQYSWNCWTDRSTYSYGQTVIIYVSVQGSGPISGWLIYVYKPDGSSTTFQLPAFSSGTRSVTSTAGAPDGQRRVEVYGIGLESQYPATCYFTVYGAPPIYTTPFFTTPSTWTVIRTSTVTETPLTTTLTTESTTVLTTSTETADTETSTVTSKTPTTVTQCSTSKTAPADIAQPLAAPYILPGSAVILLALILSQGLLKPRKKEAGYL